MSVAVAAYNPLSLNYRFFKCLLVVLSALRFSRILTRALSLKHFGLKPFFVYFGFLPWMLGLQLFGSLFQVLHSLSFPLGFM